LLLLEQKSGKNSIFYLVNKVIFSPSIKALLDTAIHSFDKETRLFLAN
jgi:hypothetical protein